MVVVIDNRAFVVGLCEMYREQMKGYEVVSLLPLAAAACDALSVSPAEGPLEGYYSESDDLAAFFRRIRALQSAEMQPPAPGPGAEAIQRLRDVFMSPAMGRVEQSDRVLPRASSPFGEALRKLTNWSVDGLSRESSQLVNDDDAGLVAVAAVSADPVALCVARESAALTAAVELAASEVPSFVWAVSSDVADVAQRFIASLAETTGLVLPPAGPPASIAYGQAALDAQLAGRCILVGEQPGTLHPYYHWYIDGGSSQPVVKDFWSSAIWTTASLRATPVHMRPAGALVGAPDSPGGPTGSGSSSTARAVTAAEAQRGRRGWFMRLLQRHR